MQDVLVYTSRLQPWTRAVEFAGRLSASIGAALSGAYVYPSPLYAAPPYSSPALIEAIFENARAMERAANDARNPFAESMRALGVREVSWHVAEAYLPDALAEIGSWHDLLVLDRDADAPWGAPSDVATLVLASRMPTIVVPPGARADAGLDCIALAWNGAPEAVRAMQAALPLLERAKNVVLLSGERRDTYLDLGWKPPFDMTTHLERHGVRVEGRMLEADDEEAGAALLDTASKLGADLLVMGAYGRSRFSEWALGGATRHVLAHAAIPVLMRH